MNHKAKLLLRTLFIGETIALLMGLVFVAFAERSLGSFGYGLLAGQLFLLPLFDTSLKTFDQFSDLREDVDEAWHRVDIFLQRRAALIPALIQAAGGHMEHERRLFVELAGARERLARGPDDSRRAGAESEVSAILNRLLVVIEAYPKLNSEKHVRDILRELRDTENSIAEAKLGYNAKAKLLNTSLEKAIGATSLGFTRRSYL